MSTNVKSDVENSGVATNDPAHSSIPAEAKRILMALLMNSDELKMPTTVTECASEVVFTPEVDSFMPTSLKMTESASALWACVGLFGNAISRERYNTEKPKRIVVDVYSATLMLCSVFLFKIDGKRLVESKAAPRAAHLDKGSARELYRSLVSNIYKTSDGRYFHAHGSLNATPTLTMLGLPLHRPDLQGIEHLEAIKDIYRKAIGERDSISLDIEANDRWLQPGVICLTKDEYETTPHGQQNIQEPLYSIHKIHDQLPPAAWPQSKNTDRPLAGVKVLDLTKVIAGPTVTRILALLGADVLRVSADSQPEAMVFIGDGQLGKRDADINLKTAEGKLIFDSLLKDADVVVSSYRPGVFERMGLGRNWIHEVARRRGKGIVYARENCYGWTGEWSHRAGYQQISDCVTGASWEQGNFLGLDEPVMPLLPNSDSQTGLTGAISIMHALLRRSSEGGSYNIDISLNQFNNWLLRKVGTHDKQTQASIRELHRDLVLRHDTGFFEMVPMVMEATKKSNGVGSGQLWDPARFTRGVIRWGLDGEEAEYLDWRKILSVENVDGKQQVVLEVDHGSCMPGSDRAEWLQG